MGRTGGTEELLELLSSPWYEQCGAEGEEGEEAMEERRKREARRGRKNKRRREGRGVGGGNGVFPPYILAVCLCACIHTQHKHVNSQY